MRAKAFAVVLEKSYSVCSGQADFENHCNRLTASKVVIERAQGLPYASILDKSITSNLINLLSLDSDLQYDSIFETELIPDWISVFQNRVRERFYESKVVKLISIHPVCSLCYAALVRGSVPKFSTRNNINVTLSQHYPDVLKDLTLTEEYLIAKSHPVGVILKLRPGGRSSPANYHALRGHFIIIPQDPKPLLQILPSPELQFTELVKVFWMGRQPPKDVDLRPFLIVRKNRVLAALQYLIQHNPLYQDVTISHSTMENWPDDFVPSALQQDIICLDETDLDERAGYSVDLRGGNCENDWQAANDAQGSFTEDSIPVTASVTVDLNGDRYNPDLRLLSTIQSLNDQSPCGTRPQLISTNQTIQEMSSSRSHHRSPVIEYGVRGQALLLNQWEDPHYFTSAFPTLFPTGRGGHLDDRHVAVSLAAFAK